MTGNRTNVTSKTPSGTSTTSTFAYPSAGAATPHAVTSVAGGAGAGSYGYDAAGNQTNRPGQTVTYNEVGKVSKVVAGSETQVNIFDADGNLLIRTSTTGGSALFLGDTTLTQATGATVVEGYRSYTAAEGKPVAQRSAKTGTGGSTLTWLFTTLEGTVDVQTNAATGATVAQYRDPFGAPAASSPHAWADGTGYMNKQVAEKTKLTNVGARTYDPALGKFTSVDPLIDPNLPQQNSGYTYSGNNPATYTDPTGLRLDEGCGWARSCNKRNVTQDLTQRRASSVPHRKISKGIGRSGSSSIPSPRPGVNPAGYPEESQRRLLREQESFLIQHHLDAMVNLVYASNDPELRIRMNAGPNKVAEDLIEVYDAKCTLASNGLNVCHAAAWPGRGGTTVGEYFITNQKTATVMANESLLQHEQMHSIQWAAFGSDFPGLYFRFETESEFSGLRTSCGNYFEYRAGLGAGGYRC